MFFQTKRTHDTGCKFFPDLTKVRVIESYLCWSESGLRIRYLMYEKYVKLKF